MKKHPLYYLLSLLLFTNLFAQGSAHSRDKLLHSSIANISTSSQLTIAKGANSLTKSVFGFLPYWELDSAVLRMDLLSHIALFDFVLNEDGSLTPPYNWPDAWLSVISEAHVNNVKLILSFSNLTDDAVDSVLVSNLFKNNSVQENFYDDVKQLISSYNLDGVILDFENPKLSERGDPINNFTQELKDSLNTWFTGKELSFATPAVNWGNMWKLKELSEICDYLFVMAYDYYGSWSTNAGPEAPLDGLPHNYHTLIENDYADVAPSKIILGVPYYGSEWSIETQDPYSSVTPYGDENSNWIGNPNYKDIDWNTFKNTFVLDDLSNTTYSITQKNDNYDLIWLDTDYSLSLKYDFALEKNLGGIGFWSLGKDGNYPELWNLIEDKFADTTTSVDEEKIPTEFSLSQN